jgi:hypothetical protein
MKSIWIAFGLSIAFFLFVPRAYSLYPNPVVKVKFYANRPSQYRLEFHETLRLLGKEDSNGERSRISLQDVHTFKQLGLGEELTFMGKGGCYGSIILFDRKIWQEGKPYSGPVLEIYQDGRIFQRLTIEDLKCLPKNINGCHILDLDKNQRCRTITQYPQLRP